MVRHACVYRAELDETGTRDTKTEAKLYFDGRICDALVEHSLQKCRRMFRTRAHSPFSSLPFLEEYIPNKIKTKDFCKVLNCPVHPLRIRQFQFGVSSLEDAENGIDILLCRNFLLYTRYKQKKRVSYSEPTQYTFFNQRFRLVTFSLPFACNYAGLQGTQGTLFSYLYWIAQT